jgi:glyoxylase-like metal-dependent hydrolase (beta-lactamase superfamily II)
VTPADALARAKRNEMEIAHATRVLLRQLASHTSAAALIAWARERGPIETNRPVIAQGAAGPKIFIAGDAPYAEIRWSDPEETTQTTYDMTADAPKVLDARITRIVAGNPGMMTGPGTNTYLVGDDALTVIDPGPPLDAHVQAIVTAGAGRIRRILCTHTHRDHSPAAAALAAITGAEVIGMPAPEGASQDAEFRPQRAPHDGERFVLGATTLRAMHTPGHASNHVCWLLEETGMLFTGDHVMQGSTVVINPPDGDMRIYLASLERVAHCGAKVIAPGHGYLIDEPRRAVERLIAHRLAREAKVVAALEAGPATVDALVPHVYDEVPSNRWPVAARSLLAHLIKLVADGRVRERDGIYALVR